jgi:hypothetical protein
MAQIVKTYLLILHLLAILMPVVSQDLENLGKENLFDIHGGFRANHVFYNSFERKQRRDPYQYIFAANLNLKFLVWQMPLSFTYTNKKGKLQHSLNQLSLRPKYKWLTVYLGKSSMTFSPYSMSGHLFEGVGVEVKPGGKMEASAFYGRMQKPVSPDTAASPSLEPVLKRMAYGIKGVFKPQGGRMEMIFFHGYDDPTSLPAVESLNLISENNTVMGLRLEQNIKEFLKLKGEVATSQLSFDALAFDGRSDGHEMIKDERNQAWNAGIEYLHDKFTFGVHYEHVDPGYRTHGTYYFNNDMENVTINVTTKFFTNKVQLSANTGLQRDNLENGRLSRMNRFVGSANVNFQPGEKWNSSVSYSNFRSYTRMWKSYEDYQLTQPYEDLDTLNFMQISQNVNAQTIITLGNHENHQHQITAFTTFQTSDNMQGDKTLNKGRFLNASMMYIFNFNPWGLSFSPGCSGYGSNMGDLHSVTVGPVLSVTKANHSKKWRNNGSLNINHTYVGGEKKNNITVIRLVSRYSLKKQHRFSLIFTHLCKNTLDAVGRTNELTITFNYMYRFIRKKESDR